MRGLNREIGRARAGEPAQVFMKMNSLTDRDVIDKISEACRAGVRVMLVIRGICCIKADIPHKTEGLIAHQIVGRFLEHARVYAFGVDTDILYLSSADMMTRNTERRVEIAYPVLDPECKERVIEFVNLQLADNVKARRLTREGTWEKLAPAPDDPRIDAQELLLAKAYLQTEEYADAAVDASLVAKANPMLEADASQTLQALPQIGRYEADVDGEPQVRTRIVTPEEFVREERQILGIGDARDVATPAAPKHMSPAEKDGAPSPEEDASSVDPVPAAAPKAPATSEPEPADAPAPVPQHASASQPAPVDARVIEDEPPAEHVARNDTQTTSIEIRRPNRFAVALKLIGLGFAELFTGNLTRRSR